MVGSFLARTLSGKHAVVVIEKSADRCERLAGESSAMIICGDACDYRYQQDAQVDKADVFAAVTGDDDDNLVACQLARISFDVPRTVARVNNPKNERIFNVMGINAVSSTTVISHLIEEETTVGEILTLHVLKHGQLALVEVDIPDKKCSSCGRRVSELGLPEGCVLVSIVRGDEVIVPSGEDIIQAGDSIIAVTDVEYEHELKRVLTS